MKKNDAEEIRLRVLLEKRVRPQAEADEMMVLLKQSECTTAQAWRKRNEEFAKQIETDAARTSEELSRQGRMTAARKRYLELSAKRMCDMTDAEHEEFGRLKEKSNCPEAKHHRESMKKLWEGVKRRCDENRERLKAAGIPSRDEMTEDEKRISSYFYTTPGELEEYIGLYPDFPTSDLRITSNNTCLYG
ncbi:MAG: hypothetical protein ISS31_09590 [Kiritimatiellae bacterium]|nr:hypothetical protein [Kiritimatiellia bacterium]